MERSQIERIRFFESKILHEIHHFIEENENDANDDIVLVMPPLERQYRIIVQNICQFYGFRTIVIRFPNTISKGLLIGRHLLGINKKPQLFEECAVEASTEVSRSLNTDIPCSDLMQPGPSGLQQGMNSGEETENNWAVVRLPAEPASIEADAVPIDDAISGIVYHVTDNGNGMVTSESNIGSHEANNNTVQHNILNLHPIIPPSEFSSTIVLSEILLNFLRDQGTYIDDVMHPEGLLMTDNLDRTYNVAGENILFFIFFNIRPDQHILILGEAQMVDLETIYDEERNIIVVSHSLHSFRRLRILQHQNPADMLHALSAYYYRPPDDWNMVTYVPRPTSEEVARRKCNESISQQPPAENVRREMVKINDHPVESAIDTVNSDRNVNSAATQVLNAQAAEFVPGRYASVQAFDAVSSAEENTANRAESPAVNSRTARAASEPERVEQLNLTKPPSTEILRCCLIRPSFHPRANPAYIQMFEIITDANEPPQEDSELIWNSEQGAVLPHSIDSQGSNEISWNKKRLSCLFPSLKHPEVPKRSPIIRKALNSREIHSVYIERVTTANNETYVRVRNTRSDTVIKGAMFLDGIFYPILNQQDVQGSASLSADIPQASSIIIQVGSFHDQYSVQEYALTNPSIQYPLTNPGIQYPMINPRIQYPLASPSAQSPLTNPSIQYPLTNPGMQYPMINPGIQYPLASPSVQSPLTNAGIQYPLANPGIQYPLIDPRMQYPLNNPSMQYQAVLPTNLPQYSYDQSRPQGRAIVRTNNFSPANCVMETPYSRNKISYYAPLHVPQPQRVLEYWCYSSPGIITSNDDPPISCEMNTPRDDRDYCTPSSVPPLQQLPECWGEHSLDYIIDRPPMSSDKENTKISKDYPTASCVPQIQERAEHWDDSSSDTGTDSTDNVTVIIRNLPSSTAEYLAERRKLTEDKQVDTGSIATATDLLAEPAAASTSDNICIIEEDDVPVSPAHLSVVPEVAEDTSNSLSPAEMSRQMAAVASSADTSIVAAEQNLSNNKKLNEPSKINVDFVTQVETVTTTPANVSKDAFNDMSNEKTLTVSETWRKSDVFQENQKMPECNEQQAQTEQAFESEENINSLQDQQNTDLLQDGPQNTSANHQSDSHNTPDNKEQQTATEAFIESEENLNSEQTQENACSLEYQSHHGLSTSSNYESELLDIADCIDDAEDEHTFNCYYNNPTGYYERSARMQDSRYDWKTKKTESNIHVTYEMCFDRYSPIMFSNDSSISSEYTETNNMPTVESVHREENVAPSAGFSGATSYRSQRSEGNTNNSVDYSPSTSTKMNFYHINNDSDLSSPSTSTSNVDHTKKSPYHPDTSEGNHACATRRIYVKDFTVNDTFFEYSEEETDFEYCSDDSDKEEQIEEKITATLPFALDDELNTEDEFEAKNDRRKERAIKYILNEEETYAGIRNQYAYSLRKIRLQWGHFQLNWENIVNRGLPTNSCWLMIQRYFGNALALLPTEYLVPYQGISYRQKISMLTHVVELYNFDARLNSSDLLFAYRRCSRRRSYLKWLDCTHCLLILTNAQAAAHAVYLKYPHVKARPLFKAGRRARKFIEENFYLLPPVRDNIIFQ